MSVARSSFGTLMIGRIAYRREGVTGVRVCFSVRGRSVIYDRLVLPACCFVSRFVEAHLCNEDVVTQARRKAVVANNNIGLHDSVRVGGLLPWLRRRLR